jgi:hypothetical protein
MINECGAKRIGNWNRSTRWKPAPEPPCPHIPRGLAWNGTGPAEKRNQRVTTRPMARPSHRLRLLFSSHAVSRRYVVYTYGTSLCPWLFSPFVGPSPLFSFLILYTVGRTSSTGDQPVAQNNTNTE